MRVNPVHGLVKGSRPELLKRRMLTIDAPGNPRSTEKPVFSPCFYRETPCFPMRSRSRPPLLQCGVPSPPITSSGTPESERELTPKAILLGLFLAFVFGAANAYLGM